VDWDIPMMALAIGLGLSIAAAIGALSQSRAIGNAVEAIARQPEAGGRIFNSLIIGLVLIETLVIYTLLVCGFFLPPKLDTMIKAKYGAKVVEAQKLEDAYNKEKGSGH